MSTTGTTNNKNNNQYRSPAMFETASMTNTISSSSVDNTSNNEKLNYLNHHQKFLDDEYEASDTEEQQQLKQQQEQNKNASANSSSTTTLTSNNNSFQQHLPLLPPGPGSEEDDFFHTITAPLVGAATTLHNTFRFFTGRMTEDQIREKITKATELREKVNRSLSRRIGNHVQGMNKKIFVGTWNVAKQSPPSTEEMKIWINGNSTVKPPGKEDLPKIAVIGIQEATMSGTAMMLETTEAVAEWSEAFQSALHQLAKDAGHPIRYRKLDGVQLVGLVMLIFLPIDEFPYVRHLRTAVTRTGPLSTVGNKGAVGCRLTFHGKRFLFICGHFAPHEHNVQQRDHHYHSALDRLELNMESESYDDLADFVLKLNSDQSVNDRQRNSEASIMSLFTNGIKGAGLKDRIFHRREFRQLKNATERSRALLHAHDYCFFFGDLNYRLVRSADQSVIKELISSHKIKKLQQFDELNLGLRKGYIFEGFHEPPVNFLPTYKFAPLTDSYDISKRKPAWTDRVLVHCLNGVVDYGDQRIDTDRTRAYLITEEWKRKRQEEIFNFGRDVADETLNRELAEEQAMGVAFMDVDDARDHYAFLKRSNSNMSFGSNDEYGGSTTSHPNTPPITPKVAAAGKSVATALKNLSSKLSPSNFGKKKSNKSDAENLLSTEQNYSNLLAPGGSMMSSANSSLTGGFKKSPPIGAANNNDGEDVGGTGVPSPSSNTSILTPLQLSPETNTGHKRNGAIPQFPSNTVSENSSFAFGTSSVQTKSDQQQHQQQQLTADKNGSSNKNSNTDEKNEEDDDYSVQSNCPSSQNSSPSSNIIKNNNSKNKNTSPSPSVSPSSMISNTSTNSTSAATALPRSSASFEDFLRALDRCSSLNNTIENRVEVDWYCSIPSLTMSDHRPVAASFDCNVAYLSKEQQEILVFDTKQELGLDFLDDLKYAL